MVTRWGMSPRVGLVYAAREDGGFLGPDGALPDLGGGVSKRLAAVIDEETKRIIEECYAVAEDTLRRERNRLIALADALLAQESLDEDEIRRVIGVPRPAFDAAAVAVAIPEDGRAAATIG
jgi:cell division protease FtsH